MLDTTDKKNCCGCAACANACPKNCISMVADEEGFLYPSIGNDKCINCGLCEKVCPIINCEKDVAKQQKAYLVRIKDEIKCKESTSGGAFTAIAESIIANGGVVFGAAFDDSFVVRHTYAEKADELHKFRNSKYVQSSIGESFKQVRAFLKQGRPVLFSGTPCQVEGLYHFFNGKPENLILVDTVCRAVPSPMIWEKYKDYRNPYNHHFLIKAAFRSKATYGYQYSQMQLEYSDGTNLHYGVESDPYLRAFFSGCSIRPACESCAFKKQYRVSDLTIWDCFDSYRMSKKFDDNKGVTRILAHTDKGKKIIAGLCNAMVEEIDVNIAVKGVHELINSTNTNSKRKAFLVDASTMASKELFEKWFPDTVSVKFARLARATCMKLGIYGPMKRIARIILGKE